MTTSPRAVQSIPIYGTYTNLKQVREEIGNLYRMKQDKTHRIFSAVPIVTDLMEGEVVFVDNGAGTIRKYTKLNGSLRYSNLT